MEHSHGTDAGLVLAGRYRLGEVLGRGGMGKVWRAHDEVLHRTVAVKELTAGLYVAEADRLVLHARTQKEARAAARITHPGVVTVHDVIEYDNRPWIVMQYVDGPSLADSAKENGEIEPREAARIGIQVLSALRAAHSAGVLHRDVKPGNVLLARDGRVLLTDFGIAAIEGDSTITRTGELVGSIDYLAPERVRGGDPGPASDLWSLGATLYTAVEGRSPFRRTSPISTMQAVVSEAPPTPTRAGPLAPVITALLRKEPADRPSASETEQMLREVLEGREPMAAQAFVPTQRVTGGLPAHGQDSGPVSAQGGGTTQLPYPADPTAFGAQPASHPAPRRGRWRTAVLVVVLAAVVGGGAGLAAMKFGSDSGPGTRTTGTTGPRTPSPSTPPVSAPASEAASESPPVAPSGGDVPAGWQRVDDPEGFSLLVPEGWKRRTDGNQIDYTPDDGEHYIRISVDPSPDFENPYMHMLNLEKSLLARLPEYRRAALHANIYRDRPASLWEFTWTESKDHSGPRHAIDQMYYADDGGPEYALYMTGPESDWETTREQFDTMLRGWRAPDDSR
ncbi:serine/threonine-protein kinase [Streptomyces sp. AM 4-1-1]|uniref:serine/threonine-protein kinase n=1 Tax=Streptomyces sp. AM 4-1-1 TaxID=3028710 RepID=UPI0023BA27C9|nr:serine/threonine-protein kinase [Streptomyces sp. AM 4-1-1]WEH35450.1 serine/threonine-protein kinase [Streptomyces sp. AM 4-1-1]